VAGFLEIQIECALEQFALAAFRATAPKAGTERADLVHSTAPRFTPTAMAAEYNTAMHRAKRNGASRYGARIAAIDFQLRKQAI